jgi:D-tyrosyl-tRNA(Tyr) deacylase
MRAVIQRVKRASVIIGGSVHSSIENGLMILLGIEDADGHEDIRWLSNKLINLRIFDDTAGVMNCSLAETSGDILLVSQFTLFASTKKGTGHLISVLQNLISPFHCTIHDRTTGTDLGRKFYGCIWCGYAS